MSSKMGLAVIVTALVLPLLVWSPGSLAQATTDVFGGFGWFHHIFVGDPVDSHHNVILGVGSFQPNRPDDVACSATCYGMFLHPSMRLDHSLAFIKAVNIGASVTTDGQPHQVDFVYGLSMEKMLHEDPNISIPFAAAVVVPVPVMGDANVGVYITGNAEEWGLYNQAASGFVGSATFYSSVKVNAPPTGSGKFVCWDPVTKEIRVSDLLCQ